MHKDFADWYRVASIEPSAELLEKRWQAIERVVSSLALRQVLGLARLFNGLGITDAQFVEQYRLAFKEFDSTFAMRENDLELRVLAGATIVCILETAEGPLGDAAALATVSSDYRGLRPRWQLSELTQRARTYLSQRSIKLRTGLTAESVTPPKVGIKKLMEALEAAVQTNQATQVGNAVKGVLEALAGGLKDLGTSAAEVTRKQAEALRVQREEANILWWLFAEYSRDLERPMKDLPLPAVCVVAAKELSDLTEVVPGPVAAIGVLDKTLRTAEPGLRESTTLQEAVNSATRDWRTAWASKAEAVRLDNLCPVILAIRKSLETDGPEDWLPAFAKTSGIDVRGAIKPLELAFQAYEESLLARLAASSE